MRLQVAAGVEIDFYNLHADAGSDSGDVNARRSGINQILSYISSNSAGRAVIIAGDTNDRYTNSHVSLTLLTGSGFEDPWIELVKGGQYPAPGSTANPCGVPAASTSCEVVDKILYVIYTPPSAVNTLTNAQVPIWRWYHPDSNLVRLLKQSVRTTGWK
jgi:hypothetical protein